MQSHPPEDDGTKIQIVTLEFRYQPGIVYWNIFPRMPHLAKTRAPGTCLDFFPDNQDANVSGSFQALRINAAKEDCL